MEEGTLARTNTHAKYGTHVSCVMPWKASTGTDVIDLEESDSRPACLEQEPVRTSGAPL